MFDNGVHNGVAATLLARKRRRKAALVFVSNFSTKAFGGLLTENLPLDRSSAELSHIRRPHRAALPRGQSHRSTEPMAASLAKQAVAVLASSRIFLVFLAGS